MYETVREINGYKVERMVGTKGFYWVHITPYKSMKFRTIKSAIEYIESINNLIELNKTY